jgi:hypothetical protein
MGGKTTITTSIEDVLKLSIGDLESQVNTSRIRIKDLLEELASHKKALKEIADWIQRGNGEHIDIQTITLKYGLDKVHK